MNNDTKPKNPNAFPRPRGEGGGAYNEGQEGMTLRDYFAAKAIVRSDELSYEFATKLMGSEPPSGKLENYNWWASYEAKLRYIHADAMLKARGN